VAERKSLRVRSIRDVASAVRGRRTELGISQAQLADRAGVSRKWIYEFEGGKPSAELGLLLRVLDALDLALELTRGAHPTAAETVDLDAIVDEHRGA
jgi:HTH-type transcriptional regulator/antitoxin HipB